MNCCNCGRVSVENEDAEFDTIVATGVICCKNQEEEKEDPKPTARKCTDIGCLLLLIAMIIGDVVILGIALSKNADPQHLWKGHDYNGKICGTHQRTAWVNISYPKITHCVSSCQSVTAYNWEPFEKYWCVPDKADRKDKDFTFDKASATYTRTVADLYTLWELVLAISLSGSIIISLIYLYMISINQRLTSYIIMNILFGLIAGILLIIHGHKDFNNDLTDYTGIIEIVFGAFILALVLLIGVSLNFSREALMTEVEMMAEAVETIAKLWSLIIFCAIYAIFIFGFFVYWVISALFIYSVPDPQSYQIPDALIRIGAMTDNDTHEYVLFETANYKYLLIYHIIFAFYILFVFCYFAYLTSAHVILVWYFGNKKSVTQSQRIFQAFGTITLYHMGTASFAALSLFFLSDIPTAFKKWIYPICKDTKCCKKMVQGNNNNNNMNDVKHDNDNDDVKHDTDDVKHNNTDTWRNVNAEFAQRYSNDDTNHTIEMKKIKSKETEQKIRKKRMYDDIKNEIFPLIDETIQNLSIEYALSETIDKKLASITCKHYYIEKQTPGAPDINKEEKKDHSYSARDYDDKENTLNIDANNKKNKKNIFNIIQENITKFNYEKFIKDDIYDIIDEKYKKLNKEIKVKREIHAIRDGISQPLQEETELKKAAKIKTIKHNYNTIRKEGLIFTSLYGTRFCSSSYRASKLEKENITRLANVEGFSQYNERFGRVGIATVNTAIAVVWMFILDSLHDNISSFIMPAMIIFMVSYTIAYVFTMIFEVTVSTLLFCLVLNEQEWKNKFAINQGKIKQNVTKLGQGLSAMLSEHLLIMQLKESEVSKKIGEKEIKVYVEKHKRKLNKQQQRKKIEFLTNRLRMTKKDALKTERQLLESIDGPMKLTEYLINVILVENLFNKRYKDIKPYQEIARRDHAQKIFDTQEYKKKSSKEIKKNLYEKVKEMNTIQNFLDFYPISDEDDDGETELEKTWKDVIKDLEIKLRKNGIKNFKMTGAKQKGIERAFYKSFYSYHHEEDGFRHLTDMLRCSFVFDDFENLYKCFKFIYSMKKEFEILRVKDRFNTPSEPCGYRDFMINIFVKNDEKIGGIICEIQLHHQAFYNAKKISHKMYKKTRLFETDDSNEAYKYAVKYIRPVIGRFKVYPIDEEEEEAIDVLKIIGKKIEKLGDKYYQQHVKPILDSNQFIIEYDKSVLADYGGRRSIILPPSHQ